MPVRVRFGAERTVAGGRRLRSAVIQVSGTVADVRHRVRDFVDCRVIPAEPVLDAGDPQALRVLREEARTAGLWALPLPAEHGGGGLALAEYLWWAEEEGRSDHGPDVLGSASLLNVRMLASHADPELREAVLPGLVRGETHASYAMTEPGVAGSDPGGLRTRADRGGDGWWTISGRKWFTSGAARADLIAVMVRTSQDEPTRSAFSLFLVPTDSPGFRVVRELDVLGCGGQYEIAFDAVRVPATHLLGHVGAGMAIAGERLALGRTLRALRWVGQAQRCLELLGQRAVQRRLGDAWLADQQLVQQLVFESELAVRSARLLTGQAAELVAGGGSAQVEVSLAKVAAARGLGRAVDAAIQVLGAEGLTTETGLPRLLRTARASRILDGADELHVTTTARRLLRQHRHAEAAVARPGLAVGRWPS
jgi:acyl-CoA dehydrogenase